MTDPRHPLEPGRDEMLALGSAGLELVARFIEQRADAPAADLEGADDLARRLRATPPPERGIPFQDALATIEEAAAKAIDTAGPGYLAYIPGGGLFASGVGELIAYGVNRFVNIAAVAPGLAAIEAGVLDWLAGAFRLPPGSQGIFTTGGSMANLSAVVAARSTLGDDFAAAAVYVSEQAHHSVAKAVRLAGFPRSSLRVVPCDAGLRIEVGELERMVAADRATGLVPLLVVGSAGTTNTGTVDPLPELAELAAREELWFHADAAYGGFFQLTERGRERLEGIERADSITLDPHKGMFLPYGTGCLLARDGARLGRAHTFDADYLQDLPQESAAPNFTSYSAELSRDNRGLRIWLPLQIHGVGAFRDALDEKLDLAVELHDALGELADIEQPVRPDLSVVCFRLRDGDDAANRRMLERINASGRIFISSTVIGGRYTLRACVLSHRTHRDRILEAVEIIAAAARAERSTGHGR